MREKQGFPKAKKWKKKKEGIMIKLVGNPGGLISKKIDIAKGGYNLFLKKPIS